MIIRPSQSSCPAITVITAVYNGEDFISACIESILSQSFGDFEYLIVDDASTDHTREIKKQSTTIQKIFFFHYPPR